MQTLINSCWTFVEEDSSLSFVFRSDTIQGTVYQPSSHLLNAMPLLFSLERAFYLSIRLAMFGPIMVLILLVLPVLAQEPSGDLSLTDESATDPIVLRVENQIFAGDREKPFFESTTFFNGSKIYDFLNRPSEITLLDLDAGKFVLLNPVARVKTEIPIKQIDGELLGLIDRFAEEEDSFIRFLFEPNFKTSLEESTQTISLEHPHMVYRITGQKIATADDGGSIVRQYQIFADSYAKLNTFLRPGSRPPFARMAVNRAVAEQEWVPKSIDLTIKPKTGLAAVANKPIKMRSAHKIAMKLSEADRQRISQAEVYLSIFNPVGLVEYQEKMTDR
jgi:hypothetical protein